MFARSQKSFTLGEAAQRALDTARQEGLALAHMAERGGEPQFWFALNILSLVAVQGRKSGDARLEPLDRGSFAELMLDAGMTRLCAPGDHARDVTELSVSRGELDRYLDWVRSVR